VGVRDGDAVDCDGTFDGVVDGRDVGVVLGVELDGD